MKSKLTPTVAFGYTAVDLTVEFLQHGDVFIPKGTRCCKLDAGTDPWVVDQLDIIEDKTSTLYHDAEHYGIRLPKSMVERVQARPRPAR